MAKRTSTERRRPRTSRRVPRNTLSRQRIIEAAVALIDDEGLQALTMPGVAKRLGVGTMSLYRHIDGKEDLLDAVARQLIRGVQVPDGSPDDWEGRVVGYLRSLRAQALRHPALGRLLAARGLTVGPVFDQLENVHAIMRAAGFSEPEAVRAFYSLLMYVFGSVIWELPRVHEQPPGAYAAAWNDALDQLDASAYPTLAALRHQLATAASPEQFEYGLQRLVGALRLRLPSTP